MAKSVAITQKKTFLEFAYNIVKCIKEFLVWFSYLKKLWAFFFFSDPILIFIYFFHHADFKMWMFHFDERDIFWLVIHMRWNYATLKSLGNKNKQKSYLINIWRNNLIVIRRRKKKTHKNVKERYIFFHLYKFRISFKSHFFLLKKKYECKSGFILQGIDT